MIDKFFWTVMAGISVASVLTAIQIIVDLSKV
jgi:hypothetical protein